MVCEIVAVAPYGALLPFWVKYVAGVPGARVGLVSEVEDNTCSPPVAVTVTLGR